MNRYLWMFIGVVLGGVVVLFVRTNLLVGGESDGLDSNILDLGRASGPVVSKQRTSSVHPPDKREAHGYKGEVIKTINASRYTYMYIQRESGELFWAAVPQITLSKGETVRVVESLVMDNFESKTLNRTFSKVIFGVLARQQETDAGGDGGDTEKKGIGEGAI